MSSGAGLRPDQDRDLSPEMVRLQLERIVESPVFSKSARLTGFLRFVVEQTLTGQGDNLKEQVLALELYGRGADFDSGADPIVRVDARRLRDKLREYYVGAPTDPVVISLPKGSYVPVFEQGNAARLVVVPAPEVSVPARRPRMSAWAAIGLAALALSALLYYLRPAKSPASELRPLASLPGAKGPPTLSPDGSLVAFTWSGPPDKPDRGIYIKSVDGEDLRRLTSRGAYPAWSPDGREIAFSRDGDDAGVFVVSQLGGAERKVSNSGTNVAWTPDAATLLIRDRENTQEPFGIFAVSLKTLERRRLTRPSIPTGDWRFAVSPDGKNLAFIRSGIPGLKDIYVIPMVGGEPRRLTDWNAAMGGLAWTPDGREIVYDIDEPAGTRLWRIPARSSSPGRGVRLEQSTGDALIPSISRPAAGRAIRLAYLVRRQEIGLRLFDLIEKQSPGVLSAPRVFQRSSRVETEGRVSPDGKFVVFLSNRDGSNALWISGLDGSNLRRLARTSLEGAFPAWSPDGQTIAFISSPGGPGIKCLFVINSSGGEPRRLAPEAEFTGPPYWSGDGHWIYFMLKRTGTYQIWKTTPAGEQLVQVTRNGGFEAQESVDGKFLYYTDVAPGEVSGLQIPVRLMRVPLEIARNSVES